MAAATRGIRRLRFPTLLAIAVLTGIAAGRAAGAAPPQLAPNSSTSGLDVPGTRVARPHFGSHRSASPRSGEGSRLGRVLAPHPVAQPQPAPGPEIAAPDSAAEVAEHPESALPVRASGATPD